MKTNIIFFIALAFIFACNTSTTNISESPTTGKTKVFVDESFQLLLDTEVYTFQALYKYAHITVQYMPEEELINNFIIDSVRTIVTSKQLSKEQMEFLKQKQIYPRTTKIAYDALALIVNKQNPDSLIKYTDLRDIFLGKITSWKEIRKTTKLDKITVVFDNSKSSNARYVREKFDVKGEYPTTFFAANNNTEVVNFVERNKNAIGLLSVNWISDKNDSITKGFMKKIQVCAISSPIAPDGPDYYKPYQGFIADNSYPFIREVYMICRETFTGLGSGLTMFVAGEVGQRIVLKSGLLPATMPIRVVQIKREKL